MLKKPIKQVADKELLYNITEIFFSSEEKILKMT